jgi:hypothetical protein
MKTLFFAALLALTMQSCSSSLKGQDPPGGTEVFRGHYVWESHGYFYTADPKFVIPGISLPAKADLLEDGIFDADGQGHGIQCSNMAAGITFTGMACDHWTYSLQGWKGEAQSDVGDQAWIFCSETGRTCYMISRGKFWDGGAWSDKLERE